MHAAHVAAPRTAADLPLECASPVTIGRCVVTTVYLDSDRPRGRIRHRTVKVVEEETGEGAEVDEGELRQLAALGLPTSFASAQGVLREDGGTQSLQQQRLSPQAGRPGARPPSQPRSQPAPQQSQPAAGSGQWLQAVAHGSGRPYYFQQGSRQAQWEPPDGNYLPAPFAWSGRLHDAPCSDTQLPDALRADAAAAAAPSHRGTEPAATGSADCATAAQRCEADRSGCADPAGSGGSCGGGKWAQSPLPRKLWKYWMQRYTLFSRFDNGILLDEEGWFSVTPEGVARHQAARCACGTVLDPFAGVGGNVIAFAATCNHVVAGDLSPDRIELLRHNAGIYGVADSIDARCGDFWQTSAQVQADVVFLSPPWGGVRYLSQPLFSVAPTLGSLDASLGQLLAAARRALWPAGDGRPGPAAGPQSDAASVERLCDGVSSGSGGVADGGSAAAPSPAGSGLPGQSSGAPGAAGTARRRGVATFLPKNTDLAQLSDLAPKAGTIEVERNILDGFFKGITVYFWEHAP